MRQAEPVGELADAQQIGAIDVGADLARQVKHDHVPFDLARLFRHMGLEAVIGAAQDATIPVAPGFRVVRLSVERVLDRVVHLLRFIPCGEGLVEIEIGRNGHAAGGRSYNKEKNLRQARAKRRLRDLHE